MDSRLYLEVLAASINAMSANTRSLRIQRCEDCGSFMRRIGFGGLWCEEPIAVFDLVPEAEEDYF